MKEQKSSRRRFFTRKLKKQSTLEDETKPNDSLEQETTKIFNKSARKLKRKSQSFNETLRSLPPPPDYEESTSHEITSLPSVTWKPDNGITFKKNNI